MAAAAEDFTSPLRAADLQPGDRVVLQGLKSRDDLNGQSGRLLSFSDDRWRVECADGECVRVRAANVRREAGVRKPAEAPAAGPDSRASTVREGAAAASNVRDTGEEGGGGAQAAKKQGAPSGATESADRGATWGSPTERRAWATRMLMGEVEAGRHFA